MRPRSFVAAAVALGSVVGCTAPAAEPSPDALAAAPPDEAPPPAPHPPSSHTRLGASRDSVGNAGPDLREAWHVEIASTTPRPGSVTWSNTPGSAGDDAASAIAVDATSRILVAGSLGGTADVGCGAHTATAAAFVAAYDATTGACVWATYFDSTNVAGVSALAIEADGSIDVAGSFGKDLLAPIGLGLRTSAGGLDGFVAKLGSNGAALWVTTFGGAGDEYAYAVASVGPRVAVGGAFSGGVARGDADAFLAEYNSADGTPAASVSFGGVGWDAVNALAVDAAGNLAAGGTFSDGAALVGAAVSSAGGLDGFVATYEPATLAGKAVRTFGGAGDDAIHGVAKGSTGLVVAGYFRGSVASVPSLVGSGTSTGFWARLGGDLAVSATSVADSDREMVPEAVAVAADGSVVMTGRFTGTTTLGVATAASDGFVARYAADGTLAWARALGATSDADAVAVAIRADGAPAVAGAFSGSIATPAGTSAGGADAFFATFAP